MMRCAIVKSARRDTLCNPIEKEKLILELVEQEDVTLFVSSKLLYPQKLLQAQALILYIMTTMGDKILKRKKTTAADLPEELVRQEILTRLPIKSAFDVGSNDFKLLPEFHIDASVHGESEAFGSKFVDINDCLYLIVYDRNSSNCMLDIYSLDGEEECCVWSKMYTIGPLDFRRQHWIVSQVFCSGEIVIHDFGMFSCYDQKTDTIKRLSTTNTTTVFVAYVASCVRYTPSLVFLEGIKSVYLKPQTHLTTALCSRVPQRLISSLKN